MTRTEYIEGLIKEQGYTIKSFAAHVGMSYSTMRTILYESFGGTSIDRVIKICTALGITVDDLQSVEAEQLLSSDVSKSDPKLECLIDNYNALSDEGRRQLLETADLLVFRESLIKKEREKIG